MDSQEAGWVIGGNGANGDGGDGFIPSPSVSAPSAHHLPPQSLTLLVSSVLGSAHLKDRMVARMPKGVQQAENRNSCRTFICISSNW